MCDKFLFFKKAVESKNDRCNKQLCETNWMTQNVDRTAALMTTFDNNSSSALSL